ncbi:MAG: hypothetical protein ACFFBD_22190 [Candidatus Hodarchaeota archaeon]
MSPVKKHKVPVFYRGKKRFYETDLVCNSCGKQFIVGTYFYICPKDGDDLCSSFDCRIRHTGHGLARFQLKSGQQIVPDEAGVMIVEPMVASQPVPAMRTSVEAMFDFD